MIYFLLAGLILELIYCYYVFNKDLFSPSAIICEVFILSTIACIFNIDKWGVDLGGGTLAVILGGNAVFIAVSTIIHHAYKRNHKNDEKNDEGEGLNYISINWLILTLVTLVCLVFSIVFVKTNFSIMSDISQSNDISQAMSAYRHETVHEDGVDMPIWLSKMWHLLGVGVYVFIFIFINNFIVNKKKKGNYLLFLSILLYLFSSAFTAQRTTILLAFIYAIFVTYSLLNRKYRFAQKLNTKYLVKGMLAIMVFLVLFGVTRGLFGRSTKDSAFDGVTYYMGNSIESLDLFIKDPIEPKQFGEELFRQFRVNLSKYGLVEEPTMKRPHLEFRTDSNGNIAGNVYTAYRYYIHDFGYGSIIIFQVIIALFYGIWYEKLNCRRLKRNIDFSFIVYAWFVLELFRFSLMNRVFDDLSTFIFSSWYIFLAWVILFRIKISFGKNKDKRLISQGNSV